MAIRGAATPAQIYRQGLKQLAGLTTSLPAEQDEKLQQIENGVFFTLLRRNTIEGMFCDPQHGGNADMVGWQMIGFPGPRMSNFGEIEKYRGEAFRAEADEPAHAAHPNRPSEDEK